MRVIKKINNSAAICLDRNNQELVAIGKGIGFPPVPYTLTDLSIITRTFYDVDMSYYNVLSRIDDAILDTSIQIVDLYKSRLTDGIVSNNLVFTLADHLQFAIERVKKHIVLNTPLANDIRLLYPLQYEIGQQAVKMVRKNLKVRLPKGEDSTIAIHLVNSVMQEGIPDHNSYMDEVITEITQIISDHFQIWIDTNSFSYTRFVSHLYYLIRRDQDHMQLQTDNQKLYQQIAIQYSKTVDCVKRINEHLKNELNIDMNEEESLYLILHINRLISREGVSSNTEH